jgi:hypothetical protein
MIIREWGRSLGCIEHSISFLDISNKENISQKAYILGCWYNSLATLRIWIQNPGSVAFFTPEFGIRYGRKSGSEIRDEHSRPFFQELINSFLGLKYLNSLMRIRIRDPGSSVYSFEYNLFLIHCEVIPEIVFF